MKSVSIFLIVITLVVGMVGCGGTSTQYNLAVTSIGGGSVTSPGEGMFTYEGGTVVNLVAEAEDGYQFINWTGNVSTIADTNDATTTITMSGDYSIMANFALGIWDWHDLDAIRDDLDGNHTLMNDLDSTTPGYDELAGPTANGGKGWEPIGTEGDPFTGNFDGRGYEIRELFIYRPAEDFVGLFCFVDVQGVIANIGLVNATITGNFGVGGLAVGNIGSLTNCYATGTVTGYAYVGGLMAGNGGTVSYCHSIGSVTGTGTVEELGSNVGGLVGVNSYGTVNHSYFAGDVTGANHTVGGLVGFNERGFVSDSYAVGSTTGSDAVGGLIGLNAGNVSESYSMGSVTGNRSVGGLVGGGSYGSVRNSFWDTQTSGQATSAGGTGKNTTEMQDIDTFTDTETEGLDEPWDIIAVDNPSTRNISYIWNIVDDETYPFLSWELSLNTLES